jgi:hypothetical protein
LSDSIFYVGAQKDKQLTGYVPARFLMRNGTYAVDPAPGGSQRTYFYSDGQGNNKTAGSFANPNNYLVVPANYSEQQARDFASQISDMASGGYPGDDTGAAGIQQALAQMFGAFSQGGSQDLQRHPQWGVPKGSVVPAFVGSASNHLGYVTGLAGLPMPLSEIGGGVLNGANAMWQSARCSLGLKSDSIDTGGPYWLSGQNHANILQGYSDGLAVGRPASPFNDFGYEPQPQSGEGQIGDGNGIAGWLSALSGVDPEEPAAPAWPPVAGQPIRYLGRRTQ